MRDKKIPVVLSRDEALLFASSQLREMASHFSLAAMLTDLGQDLPADENRAQASRKSLRTQIPEPDLQAKACLAAADMIDAWLLEERIVAARMGTRKMEPGVFTDTASLRAPGK